MDGKWTEFMRQFHDVWSRAAGGRYYMRADKAEWQRLEADAMDADRIGDHAGMVRILARAKRMESVACAGV